PITAFSPPGLVTRELIRSLGGAAPQKQKLSQNLRTGSTSTSVWEAFGGERRAGLSTRFDNTRVPWDDWTLHGQRRI
ncbi:hypothetical protein ACM614_24055, partial [Streptomyces sp. 12297]